MLIQQKGGVDSVLCNQGHFTLCLECLFLWDTNTDSTDYKSQMLLKHQITHRATLPKMGYVFNNAENMMIRKSWVN